jgi:hypothetical protein
VVARSGGRTAAAVDHRRARKTTARTGGTATTSPRPHGNLAAQPDNTASPAFTDRSLFAEGHAAAFRIALGVGSASGNLPWGTDENAIAKFLSEAINLAKQMQAAMGGHSAMVEILVADQAAGTSRQSALKVSVEPSGATAVTLQSGGGGHLVAMLQHFLMALNPASRAAA